ncbi:MAG: hypothetical protein IPH54_08035 [Rhodoferax sp.]|nr:hypothetical protein [Rhodoferax sp.]
MTLLWLLIAALRLLGLETKRNYDGRAMKVAVVLLNWNGWRDTLECLDSLFKSNRSDFSVIVCDNASSDDSVAEVTQWASKALRPEALPPIPGQAATGIQLGAARHPTCAGAQWWELGFAGGNNVGVRLALNSPACEYVWLLNNDTTVDANSLGNVIARAESDPSIGLCGSTLVLPPRSANGAGQGLAPHSTGSLGGLSTWGPFPPCVMCLQTLPLPGRLCLMS